MAEKVRSQQTNVGLSSADTNKTPNNTVGDGADSGVTISNDSQGYVAVYLGGVLQILGDGDITKDAFFAVEAPFTRISKGLGFTALTLRSSTPYAWGFNDNGQVGDDSTTTRTSPVAVVGDHSFAIMASGERHSLALKSSGTAWAWGRNASGQLGDNSTDNRSSPVSVVGAHSFVGIIGGGSSFDLSMAIKENGTTWGWGENSTGQLGDDSTNDRSSPVSVVGDHSFSEIAMGGVSSYALKSDGSLWAWGNGGSGRLATDNTTNRSSPVSAVGGHSFIKISGGTGHGLALKANGSLWAWGVGGSGRLGDNTAQNRSSPISVVGSHSFVDIAAGDDFSVALKQDGTVWTWGDDTDGELGQGTVTADRSSPVSVIGDHSFIEISAAEAQVRALKADGTVWLWGSNVLGTLGDGTSINRSSPVSVIGDWPTARAVGSIQANDKLFWNGDIAGFDLDADDVVDFNYI